MTIRILSSRTMQIASVCFALLFGHTAWADSTKDFNTWQNKLAPLYLWGVSMSGNTTFGTTTVPLEIEFKDAVSDLEGILTFHYEGAKGNWGIIADYSYLNLTPKAEIPGTPVQLNVDMKNTITEIAGLYRFGPNNPWQLLGGFRSYKLDVTIDGLPQQVKIDETINDFFIGERRAEFLAPPNGLFLLIGESALEQLKEDPLRPAVILRIRRVDLTVPVVGKPERAQL